VRLEKEIEVIKVEVLELQPEARRMETDLDELDAIAKRQGIDSHEILDQIHENKNILAQMQVSMLQYEYKCRQLVSLPGNETYLICFHKAILARGCTCTPKRYQRDIAMR
jgi:hypothetical protein